MTRACTLLIAALLALFVAGCGSEEPPKAKPAAPAATPTPPAEEAAPAEPADPLAELSIGVLAGELVMTKFAGPTATDEELQAIRDLHLGGVILFGPNVVDQAQLRALTASMQAARKPLAERYGLPGGVLVSVDQEGGSIRNVPFAPPEQTQPTLSGLPIAQVESIGRDVGAALIGDGVSMNLGPVADLAAAPNRTMAGRAFGEDAATIAPFVAAYARGMETGGVAAAAKHFPGFGASTENSDNGIAYVDRTAADLRAIDLPPFRAAIADDVDAIMVSHGIYRGLGSKLPATLEPKVVTDLLRTELGFEGVAMTDSMNAKGFRDGWGDTVPRACPVAVAAGIDLLLLTGSMETAALCRKQILLAVKEGRLEEERVREAAGRVLALKARVAP